jgi:predicted RNase H-like nuclease
MPAVLGIDAAWTETAPSGVALVDETPDGWHCAGLAPSYEAFIRLADGIPVCWDAPQRGSSPNPAALMCAARLLLHGANVAVVAVDMPLATLPIEGRRKADNEVSRAFGKSFCGTHSPTRDRPGEISLKLRDGFAQEGYPLVTSRCQSAAPALLEVYPHPALLRLLGDDQRVGYKIGKARKYWPDCPSADRRAKIVAEWKRILNALSRCIGRIPGLRPETARPCRLKQYEDAIDALICAWVGMKYAGEEAEPYGDETAAIWVPTSRRCSSGESPVAV